MVQEHSASIDGFNVKASTILANHMGMCKFDDARDIGYQRISSCVIAFAWRAAKEVAQGTLTRPEASIAQVSTLHLFTSSESSQSADFGAHAISSARLGDTFEVEEV